MISSGLLPQRSSPLFLYPISRISRQIITALQIKGEWKTMRLLHIMDSDDYENCTRLFVRHSARAIIISDGKIAMIHSLEKKYYKLPGGGIEHGESKENALVRETLEETGLHIIPETIEELGYIHRIRRSLKYDDECFVQNNYYYFCEVTDEVSETEYDDGELCERFVPVFVDPHIAFAENAKIGENDPVYGMACRENIILELLIEAMDKERSEA